jgi:glycine cleavage system H protein
MKHSSFTLELCPQVNTGPYTDGWLMKVKMSDPGEVNALLDAKAYRQKIE